MVATSLARNFLGVNTRHLRLADAMTGPANAHALTGRLTAALTGRLTAPGQMGALELTDLVDTSGLPSSKEI
jgi:hypothetical protein